MSNDHVDTVTAEEEQIQLEHTESAYYWCFPRIQERLMEFLDKSESLDHPEFDGTIECIYFPLFHCCINTELYKYGKNNRITTRLLPYCLDSLRYKKTREEHKAYCIWESLVNINFVLAYLIFFSIYMFTILIFLPWTTIALPFFVLAYCWMPDEHYDKHYGDMNLFGPLINGYIKKCEKNIIYIVLLPLFILLLIAITIIIVIFLIIGAIFAIVIDIMIILIGIVLELVLLILLIVAFIVWNILFCCYPISYTVYDLCF